ncbi:MAG: IclR family transcriptional regulator [Betaproteobacteria bacterium]|nr:IclR family transcriptional regulator [Betaproteobacteria bacterium]
MKNSRPTAKTADNAKLETTDGSVIAVSRALTMLDAFANGEREVSLGELARRTALHKTTVLRLARTMAQHGYMSQTPTGGWRLGPAAGWLGARYQLSYDRAAQVEPILRELSQASGESAAFYVREGDRRVCIARVDGNQSIRHHARMGEAIILNRGAAGRVLLAFSGEPGAPYDAIRRTGYFITAGERDPEVASVACPVFGLNNALVGCVCITGPVARFKKAAYERHAKLVKAAASRLTYELGSEMATGR